jgi:hypothetical protein
MPSSQFKSLLSLAALSTLAAGTAVPKVSHLRKRYDTVHNLASISCGGFSSADTVDTSKNVGNLNTGSEASVAANSCIRVLKPGHCLTHLLTLNSIIHRSVATTHPAFIFVTTGKFDRRKGVELIERFADFDSDSDLTILTSDVSAFAGLISATCNGGEGEGHHPVNGQAFTSDQGGYNVVVGYCNGNDDPTVPPSAYTPPGPNGYAISCGGNQDGACGLSNCYPETIAVDTQENVGCETYLGANTVGVNVSPTNGLKASETLANSSIYYF